MLFDSKDRSYLGPSAYHESEWSYLDRSGRPEAQHVREFLNHWASAYPDEHRPDLVAKLKSSTAHTIHSATFELILFALLKSLGCSVEVHPDLPKGSTKHPDFLAITPDGKSVYVEAVLATEGGVPDETAENIKHNLYSEIEKIDSPNFFLEIEIIESSDVSPSGRQLRRELESWLTSLDIDTVTRDVGSYNFDRLPAKRWEYHSPQQPRKKWIIDFRALPKKPDKRGKGQRVLGMFPGEARFVDAVEPIREALKAKTKYYGELPHPLLVALNVKAMSLDKADEMQALFGMESVRLDGDEYSSLIDPRHGSKGAWSASDRTPSALASGAWIFDAVNLWNMIADKATVYFNPRSAKALPSLFTTLSHATASEGRMVWHRGQSLLDVLGLPGRWPLDLYHRHLATRTPEDEIG